MFPPIMTLIDYDIESVGEYQAVEKRTSLAIFCNMQAHAELDGSTMPVWPAPKLSIILSGSNTISPGRLSHITELDLSDNLLGEWSEVELLVRTFPNLGWVHQSNLSDLNSDLSRISSNLIGFTTTCVFRHFVRLFDIPYALC